MNKCVAVIDGIKVGQTETPGSIGELSELMKQASDSDKTMIPSGGGTKLHIGNPPRSADLALLTCRLSGVIEYEPDNLTVSVLAGTRLDELQRALAPHRQFLPLDPPRRDCATLGGLVACNTSGPLRFRYGTLRDMVIGVKIAHADGTVTKAGGKLVKNVSGYDMCKLYTGSLGTLGLLCELTFKLQPKSQALGTMFLGCASAEHAFAAARAFLKTQLLPDALEAWNAEAFRRPAGRDDSPPWVLMVRFGEVSEAVEWQLRISEEIARATKADILATMQSAESEQFWNGAAAARESEAPGADVRIKCSVLSESAASTARDIEALGRGLGARASVFCHAGNGVLYGRWQWPDGGPGDTALRDNLLLLRQHCAAHGGHCVVEKLRSEAKAGLDVWGYDAPALRIMRRIKQEFDPKSLLNPGRFVGGI